MCIYVYRIWDVVQRISNTHTITERAPSHARTHTRRSLLWFVFVLAYLLTATGSTSPAHRCHRAARRRPLPLAGGESLALLPGGPVLPADRDEHEHGDQDQRHAGGQQNYLAIGDDKGDGHGAEQQHDDDQQSGADAEAIAAVAFLCGRGRWEMGWTKRLFFVRIIQLKIFKIYY